MNTHCKILFIVLFSFVVSISACKEEKKVPEKPKEVKKVVKVDSVKTEIEKEVLEPVVEKAVNKYFLIAASFEKESNAEKMKLKLQKEGYDSEVILSTNKLYRVSYKGFSEKNDAFNELRKARSSEGKEAVWLHIKR